MACTEEFQQYGKEDADKLQKKKLLRYKRYEDEMAMEPRSKFKMGKT